ncbi:hypothetical protein TNCV_1268311, partial [Trichonephila clavipes]
LRHDHRNPHDPGNYTNDWLDESAASYMLAGYSPQSFLIYFSDMGWRLASRAICPEIVTVVTGVASFEWAPYHRYGGSYAPHSEYCYFYCN